VSLAPYSKAIAAFFSAAAASVGAALLIGSDGGTNITTVEWIGAASTTVIATLAVFLAPRNKPDTTVDEPGV
jgi:hypothetical protein